MLIRRLTLIPVIAFVMMLFAPCGWADDYYTGLVGHLNTGSRVFVDQKTNPTLPNPAAINDQILQTGVPMVVVNIAAGQTTDTSNNHPEHATDPVHDALYATHNPLTAPIQVNGAPHHPPLLILVIDHQGYHAFGYDVNQSIAAAAGPNILQAAGRHHGDLNGAVSDFVSLMAGTPNNGPLLSNPEQAPPPPPPAPTNYAFAWAILWFFVALIVIGGVAWLSSLALTARRNKIEERNAVQDRINHVRRDVNNLAEEVLDGKDVTKKHKDGTLALADAEAALKAGDIAGARSHVSIAEDAVGGVYRKVSRPPFPPDIDLNAIRTRRKVKPHDRKKAVVAATSPQGNRVTLRNTDYKGRSAPGYRNYYDGGMYNGAYFPSGYWPYPFWTPGWNWNDSDVQHSGGVFDQPPPPAPVYPTPSYGGDSSGGGNAAFSGSSSGDRSGGGSASFAAPAPHHHTPSTDYGSSSGGGSAPFTAPSMPDFGGFGGGFGGDSSGGGNAGF